MGGSGDENLDELKMFFDPHPGFAGATIPMPAAIKKVADELDGKTMTLREAIKKIRSAAGTRLYELTVEEGRIGITLDFPGAIHGYRVIRYK